MSIFPFQYSRLPNASSIRLAWLRQGEFGDEVICALETIDIGDDIEYIALSYVWGSPEDQEHIIIRTADSDYSLRVPRNLVAALRYKRDKTYFYKLWVDSICIDQSNEDEKGQQVQLMTQIYANAVEVRIWLGEPRIGQEIRDAYDCLAALNDCFPQIMNVVEQSPIGLPANIPENTFMGTDRPSLDALHESLHLPLLESVQFHALNRLLRNPWFTRAWTWQESWVASHRIFQCGAQLFHGELLRTSCLVLFQLHRLSAHPLHSQLFETLESRAVGRSELKTLGQLGESSLEDLSDLLQLRRGAGCRYPSDLVYSLIGAARNCPAIEVNYKMTFERVFTVCSWELIKHSSNFKILSHVERQREESTLPSWVADWRVPTASTTSVRNCINGEGFRATGSSRPQLTLGFNPTILGVRGIRLDELFEVSTDPPYQAACVESLKERSSGSKDTSKITYHFTGEDLDTVLWRTHFMDQNRFKSQSLGRFTPDALGEFERIGSTLIDDHTTQEDRIAFFTLIEAVKSFSEDFSIKTFVTLDGRIGTTPGNAQSGDIIAYFLGADIPCLLRPLLGENQFSYVSECYVHGFMDGEALIEKRKLTDPACDFSDRQWLDELHLGVFGLPIEQFLIT